jgi:hypothetical protein
MKTDGGQDAVDIVCEQISQVCVFYSGTKIEKNPIVKSEKRNFALNKHVHEICLQMASHIPLDELCAAIGGAVFCKWRIPGLCQVYADQFIRVPGYLPGGNTRTG